jgi:hypothetical protein
MGEVRGDRLSGWGRVMHCGKTGFRVSAQKNLRE